MVKREDSNKTLSARTSPIRLSLDREMIRAGVLSGPSPFLGFPHIARNNLVDIVYPGPIMTISVYNDI